MSIRVSLAALACALALTGCADTSSGFSCPTSGFDGDDCRRRVSESSCRDGGVESRPLADGGAQLCCSWLECSKDPYPEQ